MREHTADLNNVMSKMAVLLHLGTTEAQFKCLPHEMGESAHDDESKLGIFSRDKKVRGKWPQPDQRLKTRIATDKGNQLDEIRLICRFQLTA